MLKKQENGFKIGQKASLTDAFDRFVLCYRLFCTGQAEFVGCDVIHLQGEMSAKLTKGSWRSRNSAHREK